MLTLTTPITRTAVNGSLQMTSSPPTDCPVHRAYDGGWLVYFDAPASPTGSLIPDPAKDHLLSARLTKSKTVRLRFLDGLVGEVGFDALGLDTRKLRVHTVRASSWGGSAQVRDTSGHVVHIDSSVLRALIDPDYAVMLRRAIADLK